MMYESGMNVAAIAEKFGREPQAIRILMSKMGVKRGNESANQESDGEKKESALKKPWYLQNQRMMKDRKQKKRISLTNRKEVLTRSICGGAKEC